MLKHLVSGVFFVIILLGAATAGPWEDGVDAYRQGDYATAMRLWRPLADKGDARAENNLGVLYEKGLGVVQDDAEAAKWYRLAADHGHNEAENNLADLYNSGRAPDQLALAGSLKWVAIASRQNVDDAISIARRYSQQRSRVVRAKNGWYAVVLGPYMTDDIASFRRNYTGPSLPTDAFLTWGTGYVNTVWPVITGHSGNKTHEEEWLACASVDAPDLAIPACTSLIEGGNEISVDLAVVYTNRGIAYFVINDSGRAFRDLNSAINLAPSYGNAHFVHGLVNASIGNRTQALADFRIAANLIPVSDPLHEDVVTSIAEIEKALALPLETARPSFPSPAPAIAPPSPPANSEPRRRKFRIGDGAVVEVSLRNIDGMPISVISVTGDFKPGDEKSFKQAVLSVERPVLVSLNSSGGSLQAGMEIGRTIWTNQFMTVVEDGMCASACAFAWLAGRPRFATPDAEIGFHAPTRVDDPDRRADSVGSAFVGGYLTELGFTAAAIAFMTESGPDKMSWLSSEKAKSLGIYVEDFTVSETEDSAVTETVECEGGFFVSVGNVGGAAAAKRCLRPGDVFRDLDVGPEMVLVPAGRFTMGSPPSEEGHQSDESPQREVTIAKPFAVGKFEVTFDEWDACVGGGGCRGYRPNDAGWARGRQPVIHVSWDDAKSFTRWLSHETGKNYRLLSEAEWEHAARAGTSTRFSCGNDEACLNSVAAFGARQTAVIGQKSANDFGLYDMHGNVWEWVEDCYHNNYAGAPGNGAARTEGRCEYRVRRGGGWYNGPEDIRAANRSWFEPESRFNFIGFRVAETLSHDGISSDGVEMADVPSETSGDPIKQTAVLVEEPLDAKAGAGAAAIDAVVNWRFIEDGASGPEILADLEVPERGMTIHLVIRRNTDPTLAASHVIDVAINTPPDFPGRGIRNVPRLVLKQSQDERGDALIGAAAKVAEEFFWIALSSAESNVARNLQLLRDRSWIDLPLVYETGQRAILTFGLGTGGKQMLDRALVAWAAPIVR